MYGWYQLEKASYKSFQTTRALLLFIMALIVAVAAVNVSSSLVMVVLEKTPEIAMLKAMGAGPWAHRPGLHGHGAGHGPGRHRPGPRLWAPWWP